MWGLLHPKLLSGEGGYYLTMLASTIHGLKSDDAASAEDREVRSTNTVWGGNLFEGFVTCSREFLRPWGCTGRLGWMAHRKWKESKQQPGTVGPGNMLGCYLVSFHILWAILSTSTVHVSLRA